MSVKGYPNSPSQSSPIVTGQPPEEVYMLYVSQASRPVRLFMEGLLRKPDAGAVRVLGNIDANGRHVVSGWSVRSSDNGHGTKRRKSGQRGALAMGIEVCV